MAPVVITDKSGNFVYTGGASGGTKITTAVAGIITKTLMMDIDLNKECFQSVILRVVQTHAISFFQINVGEGRIRHSLTLNLNDVIFNQL